jgi:hypothetical protein
VPGRRLRALAGPGLFRAGLRPVVFNGTVPVGIVLTGVALGTTRGRPMHRLRPVALAAGLGLCAWVVMLVGGFMALRFAWTATPTITRWT